MAIASVYVGNAGYGVRPAAQGNDPTTERTDMTDIMDRVVNYTPGPWVWSDDGCGNGWGRDGLEPCVVTGTVEGMISVDDADARLIAAAPDLLEVLEGLLDATAYDHGGPVDLCKKAEAIIAKVKGETI